MIVCGKCTKENQDHYKFCLGCGAELPKAAERKPFSATPPHGVAAMSSAQAPATQGTQPVLEEVAPAAPPAPPPGACPECAHVNPPTNRFCASCGFNMASLRPQAAPAPAPAPVAAPMPVAARTPVAPPRSEPPPAPVAAPLPVAARTPVAPPRAEAPPAPPVDAHRRIHLTALRADGTEAGGFDVPPGVEVTVGRDTGSIFSGDSYLSPRHATFLREAEAVVVRDEGSLNGVYLKLRANAPWLLADRDVFRIGQEIMRYEALSEPELGSDGTRQIGSPAGDIVGRLALIIGRDTTGNAFPIPTRGVHCGRERGDILFADDGYVSGLHCRVAPEGDGNVYLTDVGSSNGTFARLSREHVLKPGDILLMGQQLFRVEV